MKGKFDIGAIPMLILLVWLMACNNQEHQSDAYGNFEATEVVVSSEASAKLESFLVEEGQVVEKGGHLGFVDTTQLYLQKQQLISSIAALKSKIQDVGVQIQVLMEQKNNLSREKRRIENLLKDGAATTKQLDDVNGEIEVIDSRILATRSQLSTSNAGILSEIAPLESQVDLVNDKLKKSYISAPVNGTVLTKYAEQGELVTVGQPLFKVANLQELELRAYVSGNQLGDFELGERVEVLIDDPQSNYQSVPGVISWVASQAEFTPKIIQTKEERVNLVYAIKVRVNNDGSLKIGMPGEVLFNSKPL